MGDEEGGAAIEGKLGELGGDDAHVAAVESAGGLVEDKEGGALHEGAGDDKALLLAAGEGLRVAPGETCQAKQGQQAVGLGLADGAGDGARRGEEEFLADGAHEELDVHLLHDEGGAFADVAAAECAAFVEDLAGLGFGESAEESGEGGLARAVGADDGGDGAARDVGGEAVEDEAGLLGVAEGEAANLDGGGAEGVAGGELGAGDVHAAEAPFGDARLGGEEVEQVFAAGHLLGVEDGAAALEDKEAVEHAAKPVEAVIDDDERDAVGLKTEDEASELVGGLGGEVGRRLVHHHEVGLGGENGGKGGLLFLAGGEGEDGAAGEIGEVEHAQGAIDALADFVAGTALPFEGEGDLFLDGGGEELLVGILKDGADAFGEGLHRHGAGLAGDAEGASEGTFVVVGDEAVEQAQEGGLTAAAGAGDKQGLALAEAE